MDIADLTSLREFAEKTAETDSSEAYAPTSNARMSAVARAVLAHAEQFNLDGSHPDAQLPLETYLASFAADVLQFADVIRPTSGGQTTARDVLEHAITYLGEAGTSTYEGLRGFRA